MSSNKLKVLYICTGVYHLFTSVYFSSEKLEGYKDGDIERILVFYDAANKNIPVHIFHDYFDKIYYLKSSEYECKPVRVIKRSIYGRFFPFTKLGQECYSKYARYRAYVYNDYDLVANRIIQAIEKRKESIILVEEGLLTYSVNQYWLSMKRHRILDYILGIKIKGLVEHNHAIDTILCRYPEKLPDVKKAGRIIKKLENVFSDTAWVSKMLEILGIHGFQYNGKVAIWLGQPIDKDEIALIRRIAEILGNEYKLLIKAHPRDKKGKYDVLKTISNIELMDVQEWVPIELLLSQIKPDIGLSLMSSAMDFVLQANHKAKIIYCAKVIGLSTDKNVESMFVGDNKYYPDSLEEIEKIIML